MGEEYILIVAKEQNGKNVLTEHIADMAFLMKIEKGDKRTKIPYKPASLNPGTELVKFINTEYPDARYLITGRPLRFGDNLKNGENVTFAPWTTVDDIAQKYKYDQIYSNQVPTLKSNESPQQEKESAAAELNSNTAIPDSKQKNDSGSSWLLFIIILLIVFLLIYYSGNIPIDRGIDLSRFVNFK